MAFLLNTPTMQDLEEILISKRGLELLVLQELFLWMEQKDGVMKTILEEYLKTEICVLTS